MNSLSNEVILPIYLQKYLIKFLCYHINFNNKIIDLEDILNHYRINEQTTKNLMLNIALTCKEWFKTLKIHLNVSVDFNYSQKSPLYSIIQFQNIKYLKLHFDHERDCFYKKKGPDGIEEPIEHSLVLNEIKKLSTTSNNNNNNSNKKVLILRNVRITTLSTLLSLIQQLNESNIFENFRILEFKIDDTTRIDLIDQISKSVKTIFTIIVDGCNDINILIKIFSTFSNSIKHFYIASNEIPNIIQLLTGSIKIESGSNETLSINYLKNIEYISIYSTIMTILDIETLLIKLPKLKQFTINICFNNLIYFLSTKQERIDLNQMECTCNSVIPYSQPQKQIEFNNTWSNIRKLFENNKVITQLEISHECNGSSGSLRIGTTPIPKSFVKQVGGLVSSIVQLKKLITTGFNSPDTFEMILQNNKSITHFDTTILQQLSDTDLYVKKMNELIKSNPQIKEFKFTKFDETLINVNK